jgi:addiction module HigA family antidote
MGMGKSVWRRQSLSPRRGYWPLCSRKKKCPGETAGDILPALNMSNAEVADAVGIFRQHLHDIVREKKLVSPELAVRLGKAFGGGPMHGSGCRRLVMLGTRPGRWKSAR